MHSTKECVLATVKVEWVRLRFALLRPCAATERIVIKSYDLADAMMLGQEKFHYESLCCEKQSQISAERANATSFAHFCRAR
jgi:hypothetical protein